MTLNTFIKTIKNAGKIPGTSKEIAIKLYQCTEIGYAGDSIIAALSKSEKKNRPPLPIGQNSINEWEFIRFFAERTINTWPEMQKAFGTLDEEVLIDLNTRDRNVFFESLLAQFYEVLKLAPVSLLNILPQAPLVLGREIELKQLDDIFETSNYAILTGVGGIGKSCVALAYAHTLKKNGNWTVQHVIYEINDTLQTAITKLQFTGSPGALSGNERNLNDIITYLKHSRKHMLIVLDNLNRPFTAEDFDMFERLTKCGNHVRILISSRNTLVDDKQCRVHLDPLDDDALLEFYAYHRFENADDHKDYIVQHKDILMKLFLIVEKHTLMIELIAKLPNRLFEDEYKIYDRLSRDRSIPSDEIVIKKDGKTIKASPKGLIKILFGCSHLTDDEKSIMRYLSIMPANGIDIKLFEELTRCSRREILGLKKSHWIIMDEEKLTIRLHQLVREAIFSFDDTEPTTKNCAELFKYIRKKRDEFEEGSLAWRTHEEILLNMKVNFFFRELASADPLDCINDRVRKLILDLEKNMNMKISLKDDSTEIWVPLRALSDNDDS